MRDVEGAAQGDQQIRERRRIKWTDRQMGRDKERERQTNRKAERTDRDKERDGQKVTVN